MGIRNVLVSDISGAEIEDGKAVEVVIRQHPELDSRKRFDASSDELKNLKTVDNLVVLELKEGGETRQVTVALAEFNKVVGEQVLAAATNTRGRRPGYSPNG